MTPARWQQVKGVLATAIEQPNEEARAAFLASHCGDDTALRREVCSLLEQPTDAFDTCAAKVGLLSAEPVLTEHAGRRLGAYELLRELGRGGMGAVWLARRADEQFEKLVAIKLLKRGTDTDEVLRRFQAERQILARLDHPNIARLLDAGVGDDGLPYFVMEYVDGERLTDFVHTQKLSLGERLRLFRKICHAVQFAHQNLVIHRDLKPGNILVTAEGEPKLLDFGVAKLLLPGDDSWQLTLVGGERFTPGYASPEQVRGEAVTTVSDVYSLGALLYEILTGVSRHRFAHPTPTATQVVHVVCEEEPARPSTIAREPELGRQLRGDLDTILLRALAKAPGRRYRGAGNLADDLQRYLENRPVHARPDTVGYRARKFFRRNRAVTIAAALVLLSLVAGVIATARQAQIANREKARAERRFNEVRKIANSFMFEFHDSIADLPGALSARQLVTQRAVEYLDSLAQEAGDDLSLKSELALAYRKIGSLIFDLHQGISAHEKALTLDQAIVRAAPGNSAARIQLSESYGQLSDAMKIAGHSRAAIDDARHALATIQSVANPPPAQVAARHLGLGLVLLDAGDFRAALAEGQSAVVIQQALQAQNAAGPETTRDLETGYSLVSDASADAGDYAGALSFDRKALALAEGRYRVEPGNSGPRRDMWAVHFRFGRHLAATGEAQAALDNYRQAAEFLEGLAAADPDDTGHQRWLALTYSAIGSAHQLLGQWNEARALQEKALALSEKLVREDPERIEAERDVVKIKRALGFLLLAQNDAQGALAYFANARTRAEKLVAHDSENARVLGALANACDGLAQAHQRLGENPAAEKFLHQSRQIWAELKAKRMLTAADAAKASHD